MKKRKLEEAGAEAEENQSAPKKRNQPIKQANEGSSTADSDEEKEQKEDEEEEEVDEEHKEKKNSRNKSQAESAQGEWNQRSLWGLQSGAS